MLWWWDAFGVVLTSGRLRAQVAAPDVAMGEESDEAMDAAGGGPLVPNTVRRSIMPGQGGGAIARGLMEGVGGCVVRVPMCAGWGGGRDGH
jgi:hypothetical protein